MTKMPKDHIDKTLSKFKNLNKLWPVKRHLQKAADFTLIPEIAKRSTGLKNSRQERNYSF